MIPNVISGEFREWRLLGQERDGCFLFSWLQIDNINSSFTNIGLYDYRENDLKTIYSFERQVNVIQASINSERTILGLYTYFFVNNSPECFDFSVRYKGNQQRNSKFYL